MHTQYYLPLRNKRYLRHGTNWVNKLGLGLSRGSTEVELLIPRKGPFRRTALPQTSYWGELPAWMIPMASLKIKPKSKAIVHCRRHQARARCWKTYVRLKHKSTHIENARQLYHNSHMHCWSHSSTLERKGKKLV